MTTAEAAAVETVQAPAETAEANPLLANVSFPKYDQVTAGHVVPGVRQMLKELHAEIDK